MINANNLLKYFTFVLIGIYTNGTVLLAQDQTVNGNLTVSGSIKVGTSTSSGKFEVRSNGIIIWKGNSNATLLPEDQGIMGSRMIWHPGKSAFRAGFVDSEVESHMFWDEYNIGVGSVAFGINTMAPGRGAIACGVENWARGDGCAAFGINSVALDAGSFAAGSAACAAGYRSVAMGTGAFAMDYSVAIGWGANAVGLGSTAFGHGTNAAGDISTSFGEQTEAGASHSFVIGRYNIGGGNATQWVNTDPLFEIGNGQEGALSNAFTVYKNGNANLQGNFSVSGTNSQMPNQTITGTGSILTKGLADDLYMSASTTNSPFLTTTVAANTYVTTTHAASSYVALNPITQSSRAIGYQSIASSTNSIAMGYGTVASGAISTAMGYNSQATAPQSTAMGYNALANGWSSLALGYNVTSTGVVSTAMGVRTTASGYGQFVIGRFNTPQGNPDTWVPTDDLFIIGNGTSSTAPANAFVVKKNGDTAINGTASVSGGLSVTGPSMLTGTTTVSGGLNVAGNITTGASSKLIVTGTNSTRIAPQGDLSMGEFTTESSQ